MMLRAVMLVGCGLMLSMPMGVTAEEAALPTEAASVLQQMGIDAHKAQQVLTDMQMPESVARQLLDSLQKSPADTAQTFLDLGIAPDTATDMLRRMGMQDTAITALMDSMGEAITREQKKRDSGWGDSQARMLMILRDQDGNERQREILVKTLEVPGNGSKSLSVFESPRDVRNTALLTETRLSGPDNQWLYLPKLKRVKRIAMINKSSPFMGSQFSYEDLASFEVEKYSIRYLRDETLDGTPCFVVEMVPRDEHSGYRRLIAFVEKKRFIAHRMDYYDQQNTLQKIMQLQDYKLFGDRFWRATRLVMTDRISGLSTVIIWQDYRFNTGLTDNDFTTQALKRAG